MLCILFIIGMFFVAMVAYDQNLKGEAEVKHLNEIKDKIIESEQILQSLYSQVEYDNIMNKINAELKLSSKKSKMYEQKLNLMQEVIRAYGSNKEE